jgi:hypothetical protein
MTPSEFEKTVTRSLEGEPCWFACHGGVGSCFQLACGAKVRRESPLRNRELPTKYRWFEGTANLLVWCTWRVERGRRILASSRDNEIIIARTLESLCKQRIVNVQVARPFWDIEMTFEAGHRLRVFADHPSSKNATQDNWYLTLKDRILYAGPGVKHGVELRYDSK